MNFLAQTFALTDLSEQFSQFAGVKIWVSEGDTSIDSSPYEQERELVQRAVMSRKLEFYSGRYYARQALQQAGVGASAILRGQKGNPLWPQGILGSITHDAQQVITAVTREGTIAGMGIDLIQHPASVEFHLQPLIASHNELKELSLAFPAVPSLALAFSLKESVVKAISPGIDYYLELLDIHLTLEEGAIVAKLPHLDAILSCQFFNLQQGFVTLAVLAKKLMK